MQRVVKARDHACAVLKRWMLGDLVDALAVDPDLAAIVETVEIFAAGVRQGLRSGADGGLVGRNGWRHGVPPDLLRGVAARGVSIALILTLDDEPYLYRTTCGLSSERSSGAKHQHPAAAWPRGLLWVISNVLSTFLALPLCSRFQTALLSRSKGRLGPQADIKCWLRSVAAFFTVAAWNAAARSQGEPRQPKPLS